MPSHRVIITGDRRWACRVLAQRVVDRLIERHGESLVIVHGGATGVDSAFGEAAGRAGVAVEVFEARWEEHGKSAGPRRNEAMVKAGADLCLAFHRNIRWSRGTNHAARTAIRAGIPTWLVDSDDPDARPRKITESDLD